MLDTSVVVHLVRYDAMGKAIEEQYALRHRSERPLLSSIVEGEMLSLARGWEWEERRMAELQSHLNELVRVDAGLPEVVRAYVDLYCEATRRGQPRGENDLWIAATARAAGAVLITCDRDFIWLHPHHVEVRYIAQ